MTKKAKIRGRGNIMLTRLINYPNRENIHVTATSVSNMKMALDRRGLSLRKGLQEEED